MSLKKSFLLLWLFSINVSAQAPVVLLSIDGFAQRYFDLYQPQALLKLKQQGTSAAALLSVYPSKTFPNHVSIVTGQYPANHGIVHNNFFNRKLNEKYSLGKGKADSRWLTAKPIWHINEQYGNKSALYFWPESETAVEQSTSTYVKSYHHSTPNKDRLMQILAWLRLPEAKRPTFITGYFSTVDSAGHEFGENSVELKESIDEIDNLIAEFMHTIKTEFAGQVNVVIVSDHGMTKMDKNKVIQWRDLIANKVKTLNSSTQLYLYSEDKVQLSKTKQNFLEHLNKTMLEGVNIYQYPHYPEHWQLAKTTASTPDMIIDAIPPYSFKGKSDHISAETHGYDPKGQADLEAIFIATGPNFEKGKKIAAFENVHIMPILTRLLGLPDIKNIDGKYKIADKVVLTK